MIILDPPLRDKNMSGLENMTKEELIKIILKQSELLRIIDKKTKEAVVARHS